MGKRTQPHKTNEVVPHDLFRGLRPYFPRVEGAMGGDAPGDHAAPVVAYEDEAPAFQRVADANTVPFEGVEYLAFEPSGRLTLTEAACRRPRHEGLLQPEAGSRCTSPNRIPGSRAGKAPAVRCAVRMRRRENVYHSP